MKKKTDNNNDKPSWFKIGEEGLREKERQDTALRMKRNRAVPRFWLKPDEEATVVFVDDLGFYVKTHQLQIDGKWQNFITCIRDIKPCPICNSANAKAPVLICYFTVIDTREIVYRDGTKIKNRKVLLPAKSTLINMIFDIKKKYNNSLVGLPCKIKRYTNPKALNCGDYIEAISKKRIDLSKFGEDATKPFDYKTILAPPTEEELQMLGYGITIVGSEVEDIDDEELNSILA